jgi:uncharacterized damage-inducible protein DinB
VHDLQCKVFAGWREEKAPTIAAWLAEKRRILAATLSRPSRRGTTEYDAGETSAGWFGELRTPACILLHVITHTFHHEGQVVAMLRWLGHPAPDTDLQREGGATTSDGDG